VMVSARRFAELGAPVTEEIPDLSGIETTTRNLTLDFEDAEPAGENGKSLSAGMEPQEKSKNAAAD
jgi:hypothetical protein